MDQRERPFGADRRAEAGEPGEADGVIDRIGGPGPAAAERNHRHADRARVDRCDEARAGRRDRANDRRRG